VLALPALGAIAAEPAYSLADTAIIGHLGRTPLGALAIATTALTMTAWLAIFLSTATTSAVAGLAAGRDPGSYIRAMEAFASKTGLLPEQVWDEPDWPGEHLFLGGPTGAAMPLMWAHAEYVKLLRSARDGQIFARVPGVAERYIGDRSGVSEIEVWKFNRQARTVRRGTTLRVIAGAPFEVRWTAGDWSDAQ